MGLLLFWRNAAHHFENETNETEPQHGARYQPDFSATHSKSLALVSVSNGTRAGQELNLKEDALQSLRPIFHRLQNLDLVSLNFILCVREREGVCVCVKAMIELVRLTDSSTRLPFVIVGSWWVHERCDPIT